MNRATLVLFTASLAFVAEPAACQSSSQLSCGAGESAIPIKADAGPILVPVMINNAPRVFMLDTGSGVTVIDETGAAVTFSENGRPLAIIRDVDQFSIGKHSCGWIKELYAVDLTAFKAAGGIDIDGILGMDVLSHFVVVVDFDNEILRLDRPATELRMAGDCLDLEFDGSGRPCVAISVCGKRGQLFLVDSGLLACNRISKQHAESLLRDGVKLTESGRTSSVDVYGRTTDRQLAVLPSMEVGRTPLKDIAVASSDSSAIGLPFLYRFAVVFDFPRRKSFWTRGNLVNAVDRGVQCGIDYTPNFNGSWVVTSVADRSIARQLEVRVGDVITSVGGIESNKQTSGFWSRLLSFPQKRPTEVILRRNALLLRVEIPTVAR